MDKLSEIYSSVTCTLHRIEAPRSCHHATIYWLQAIARAYHAIMAFDRGGSLEALQLLQPARISLAQKSFIPRPLRISLVQKDAEILIAWIRLLTGGRACFSESIALCTGLRTLGWECSVVVAYANVELYTMSPMHAWVEYESVPVHESIEVHYSYVELQRFEESPLIPDHMHEPSSLRK